MSYPARKLERVSEPAAEPISVSEAKSFLRIGGSDDDALIGDLIATARIIAEQECGQSLITQSWKIAYNDYAPEMVHLPNGPVQSITSVKSIDEADAETTIAPSSYHIDASGETLVFEAAASGHRIEIVYAAGYGAASDVPSDIAQGILLHVAHLYEHRDSVHAPQMVQSIYARRRQVRV